MIAVDTAAALLGSGFLAGVVAGHWSERLRARTRRRNTRSHRIHVATVQPDAQLEQQA